MDNSSLWPCSLLSDGKTKNRFEECILLSLVCPPGKRNELHKVQKKKK
jgi:hypothetical protein